MKRVDIISSFKHNGVSYYEGELRRVVSEEDFGYFIGQGWALDADDPNAKPVARDLSEKKLTIQGASHRQKTTKL